MTLVVGIATPKGVALGSDGLVSWGTSGTFQTPTTKLFAIGTCFALGVAGARHLDDLLARALQQSTLAQATSASHTKASATTVARDTIKTAIEEYLRHVAFNPQRPLNEQIGYADLLLVGLCADGPLIVGLDSVGNWYPPATPNWYAIGSGAVSASLLLRAYSKYDYAQHPLETSVLLIKRVLDMVAATMTEIGGPLSVIRIAASPNQLGQHLSEVDLASHEIQAGMSTWELLEEEMFAGLAAAMPTPTTKPALPGDSSGVVERSAMADSGPDPAPPLSARRRSVE